jgi:hypothetical protein
MEPSGAFSVDVFDCIKDKNNERKRSLHFTGVFNKYIAFLNKNSYFSINHQTLEDGSLAQNGTNQCGKIYSC